ncbi:hypothetical protein HPT25_26350 [Bacillus sp. BRMEA1]|uniref:hypothetical protein n=1 Tax=Neobacillus endophyticus TaxID=2738405 RepID=UPI0015638B10|nr:hypothetical protein [Neobacillus endophyticus]NRD80853.1 hypothetical protein [Neobacillus endophyticus]
MTVFNFYTQKSQFTIGPNYVVKNGGEVIAEGSIFIFQLLLGYPAWIFVNADESEAPQIIKTEPVISVLPENEFFDGIQNPPKHLYQVDFLERKRPKRMTVTAVDEHHVRVFLKTHYTEATNILIKQRIKERVSC